MLLLLVLVAVAVFWVGFLVVVAAAVLDLFELLGNLYNSCWDNACCWRCLICLCVRYSVSWRLLVLSLCVSSLLKYRGCIVLSALVVNTDEVAICLIMPSCWHAIMSLRCYSSNSIILVPSTVLSLAILQIL